MIATKIDWCVKTQSGMVSLQPQKASMQDLQEAAEENGRRDEKSKMKSGAKKQSLNLRRMIEVIDEGTIS